VASEINGLRGDCKITGQILARIGDKWSVFVIGSLAERTMRFSELRRRIGGVSQRMLTLTLRSLERDGLIKRTVYPTVPPRVDYELTPLGRTLIEPLRGIALWAQGNMPKVIAAREAFDAADDERAAA
jgi:DNA-binding HxlR family transcriptional regulator